MTYPAIQIGTQWVMVDKTRKPNKGEVVFNTDMENFYVWDETMGVSVVVPVLAARVKPVDRFGNALEGVPLIPEAAFKVPNMKNIVRGTFQTPQEKLAFDSGFTTAGGYTREDMLSFATYCTQFRVPVTADLLDKYTESVLKKYPTEIDCAENEDGSLKIVDDTIVLNEVIR